MKLFNLALSGLFSLLFISSCSNTKLLDTWSDQEVKVSYKDILVVGITTNKVNRRAFESNFVASFQAEGIESMTSYSIISQKEQLKFSTDKKSFKNIVKSAIAKSSIDAVLISHVSSIETDQVYNPSLDFQPVYGVPYGGSGYYGNMYGYHGYVTTYVQEPGYYSDERTYTLEASLYDVKTEQLVWTTKSRTVAPESVETTIQDITNLIIQDLLSRKLIK